MVVVGESAVGKSSLTRFFTDGGKGCQRMAYEATIGGAFSSKYVRVSISNSTSDSSEPVTPVEIDVKLDIWDTAGAERYHSITPMYYRNARAAVVVYDISDAETFERAKAWVSDLREKIDLDTVIALVGNKVDLGEEVSFDCETTVVLCHMEV